MGTKTYTMKDWERDGSLRLSPDMLVDTEVICELRDCVPPAFHKYGVFQVGEPASHDTETFEQLYDTFLRLRTTFGTWKYLGLCPLGSVKPSEHPYK